MICAPSFVNRTCGPDVADRALVLEGSRARQKLENEEAKTTATRDEEERFS